MTASAGPVLKRLYREYGDRVEFVTVYTREAHPGERYSQAETMGEKIAHARAYEERDGIPWTIAVDDLDGSFHQSVDPKPNSAYFVDVDGSIVFRMLWTNDEAGLRGGFERLLATDPRRERGDRQVQMTALLGGLGRIDDTLGAAGDGARRDFRRSLPPVYALAKLAGLFRPLSDVGRSLAAIAVVSGTVGALVLGWRAKRRAA